LRLDGYIRAEQGAAVEETDSTISYPQRRRSTTVESIVNTLELVVTALILAFIFRAFVAEAFRIPTGSMAETLKGAHYHLRCIRCGYAYDMGGDMLTVPEPRCPSCGYKLPKGMGVPISNGDRIIVAKCIYQFIEPKRWDVIVFKNPTDPRENYIKRLLACPGETIEIIDGDVYIDGLIARKPPRVQKEMWMPIYDNDYQAVRQGRLLPDSGGGESAAGWEQPFENEGDGKWDLNASGPTVFALDTDADDVQTIVYNSRTGNDFHAAYAYNDSASRYARPNCSDLMVKLDVTVDRQQGRFGAALNKYGIRYEGAVDFSGRMMISMFADGKPVELTSRTVVAPTAGRWGEFSFANVDHQLVLEYAGHRLSYDLGSGPRDLGSVSRGIAPEVRLFGAGGMRLWHVKLFRDTHYIGERVLRGGEGREFTLGKDEFFACGDNSPASFDSRMWGTDGIGNEGMLFRKGIVPREYMMGKAFFIYWADAFKPTQRMLPMIPNFSGLKVVYGGSDKEY